MNETAYFKMNGNIQNLMDKYDRRINDVKKIDLANNLMYALTVQFVDRMEKNERINREEKQRLKDEIETKEGSP